MAKKYRGERRNLARANKTKFPWGAAEEKILEASPVRPNKRDRSPAADAQRAKHVTMDFTDGAEGISRSLINYKPATLHQKKPKHGWAAEARKAPFADYLPAAKMAAARARHVHPRKKRIQSALQLMAAE